MKRPKPLSLDRWRHSLSVANFAYDLALFWGYPPFRAYTAGLLHDMAREVPEADLLAYADQYHLPCGEEEKTYPILLHGSVGALMAKEFFGLQDEEILSAIAKHTVGDLKMSLLDKIIYRVADKCEPLRTYEEAKALRKLAYEDLDRSIQTAIAGEIAYLTDRGLSLHPITVALEKSIKERKKHH